MPQIGVFDVVGPIMVGLRVPILQELSAWGSGSEDFGRAR